MQKTSGHIFVLEMQGKIRTAVNSNDNMAGLERGQADGNCVFYSGGIFAKAVGDCAVFSYIPFSICACAVLSGSVLSSPL